MATLSLRVGRVRPGGGGDQDIIVSFCVLGSSGAVAAASTGPSMRNERARSVVFSPCVSFSTIW